MQRLQEQKLSQVDQKEFCQAQGTRSFSKKKHIATPAACVGGLPGLPVCGASKRPGKKDMVLQVIRKEFPLPLGPLCII